MWQNQDLLTKKNTVFGFGKTEFDLNVCAIFSFTVAYIYHTSDLIHIKKEKKKLIENTLKTIYFQSRRTKRNKNRKKNCYQYLTGDYTILYVF